jgi:hypothetical protein
MPVQRLLANPAPVRRRNQPVKPVSVKTEVDFKSFYRDQAKVFLLRLANEDRNRKIAVWRAERKRTADEKQKLQKPPRVTLWLAPKLETIVEEE